MTHNLHVVFKITYLYDSVTKLYRQQVKVMLHHENVSICNIGQSKAQQIKYKRLKPGSSQAYD
jgi:hypothetical protein